MIRYAEANIAANRNNIIHRFTKKDRDILHKCENNTLETE